MSTGDFPYTDDRTASDRDVGTRGDRTLQLEEERCESGTRRAENDRRTVQAAELTAELEADQRRRLALAIGLGIARRQHEAVGVIASTRAHLGAQPLDHRLDLIEPALVAQEALGERRRRRQDGVRRARK